MNTQGNDSGFVLPYILIVIGILSLSLILISERIQKTSGLIMDMHARFASNLALNTAEAEAIYAVMTASPTQFGLEMNPRDLIAILEDNSERTEEADVWHANGGLRQTLTSSGGVIIEYRDGSGLVSVNTADEETLRELVRSLGVQSQKQAALIAKLKDYLDPDSRRRHLGAERSDYRLRQLPSPSNGSIRKVEELGNILGWRQFLINGDKKRLSDRITVNQKIYSMKKQFVDQDHFDIERLNQSNISDENNLLARSVFPTDISRLSFFYRSEAGDVARRTIEIDKTISVFQKPFTRQLVYQDIIPTNKIEIEISRLIDNPSGLKHVIYAETYRYK